MTVEIQQLTPPAVVEQLDYELILEEMKQQLNGLQPLLLDADSRQPVVLEAELVEAANGERFFKVPVAPDAGLLYLQLESEPVVKQLQVGAYREMLVRQRINTAAKAVMLAYSTGSDLEHLGVLFGVSRLVVDPGDPDALPPVEPTRESDERLRRRIQIALEGITTAGSVGSYTFHALSASGSVRDVSVVRPSEGEVAVTVLSESGNGQPDQALLDVVAAGLSAEDVRPLNDHLSVQAAEIVEYSVEAVLTVFGGPDAEVVRQSAELAVTAYVSGQRRIGRDITLSGLYASLHRSGVQNVQLVSPVADIGISGSQAAWCTGISVSAGVGNE